MNNKIVIPCEQCRRLVGVPTNRGSIKVQCPHCRATFMTPDLTITKTITKKKCLNCGYKRQPEDESAFISTTDCPRCGAIYEKVEKILKESELEHEREHTRERIIREEEQKIREREREREAARLDAEQIERRVRQRNTSEIAEREARERSVGKCEATKTEEDFKPKGKMGFFMKIAVKTAAKKNLLDITDRLNLFPNLTIKEKVEMFVTLAGMSYELPPCVHWEGTFFVLVLGQTRGQLTALSNFTDYIPIIADLTSDWINRVLGGKSENMYAEINRLSADFRSTDQ